MNSLQSEVDQLKVENLQKQSTIEQLLQQVKNFFYIIFKEVINLCFC